MAVLLPSSLCRTSSVARDAPSPRARAPAVRTEAGFLLATYLRGGLLQPHPGAPLLALGGTHGLAFNCLRGCGFGVEGWLGEEGGGVGLLLCLGSEMIPVPRGIQNGARARPASRAWGWQWRMTSCGVTRPPVAPPSPSLPPRPRGPQEQFPRREYEGDGLPDSLIVPPSRSYDRRCRFLLFFPPFSAHHFATHKTSHPPRPLSSITPSPPVSWRPPAPGARVPAPQHSGAAMGGVADGLHRPGRRLLRRGPRPGARGGG